MTNQKCPTWNPLNVADGLCRCGCGKIPGVASRNRKERGILKGQYLPYYRFHEGRLNFTIAENGCWNWNGKGDKNGYGVTRWDYKPVRVFRALYEQLKGSLPAGLMLDHLCRNTACVNPIHLEPVTNAENVRRGDSTKLTREQVNEIIESPLPQTVLAEKYGVVQTHISRIKRRVRWN